MAVKSKEDLEKMKSEFYNAIEKISQTLNSFVEAQSESNIIRNYCLEFLDSFTYSNLVLNFFYNLNRQNVIEERLPTGMIKKIRNKYVATFRDTNLVLKSSMSNKEINKEYYQAFKRDVRKKFPAFAVIFYRIEKILDIKYLEKKLRSKKERIRNTKGKKDDLFTDLYTKILEQYIISKKLPILKRDREVIGTIIGKSIDASFKHGAKILEKISNKTVTAINRDRDRFEKDVYNIWKQPLDLLSLLINSSIEIGQGQRLKLKDKKIIPEIKREVLFRIHARAVQVANEILTLLRSGYADGAYARWRTLYELTAIFLILKANGESLTSDYLDHSATKAYKELSDFDDYRSRLHYSPISKKEALFIKRDYRKLKRKYGENFKNFKRDYGWIPAAILADCNFKALTKKVGIDHYLPFYNFSLNASHGGSRGFYRMGLTTRRQNKVLLAGPSVYGLADPIQDTAYCIILLNAVLLSIKTDYQNVFLARQLQFFDELGKKAVNIQKELDRKM
jgi:hypothetical protein